MSLDPCADTTEVHDAVATDQDAPAGEDIAGFRQRAQRFAARHGWSGADAEDLVSLMVLYVLERPGRALALNYVYMNAVDAMNPKSGRTASGKRGRQRQREVSLDTPLGASAGPRPMRSFTLHEVLPAPAADPDLRSVEAMAGVPAHGPLRAMLLLYAQYGYTLREIGALFGVTESRLSQIFGAWRQQQTTAGGADAAHWETTWITL